MNVGHRVRYKKTLLEPSKRKQRKHCRCGDFIGLWRIGGLPVCEECAYALYSRNGREQYARVKPPTLWQRLQIALESGREVHLKTAEIQQILGKLDKLGKPTPMMVRMGSTLGPARDMLRY